MTRVLALDVDGVLLPFDPPEPDANTLPYGPWGTSLELLTRLSHLQDRVEIIWLTTWLYTAPDHFSDFIRPAPFLDRDARKERGWWKATALLKFLAQRDDVTTVVWCDDHLKRYHQRRDQVRRHCERAGVRLLDLCPNRATGLTTEDMDQIEAFLANDVNPS